MTEGEPGVTRGESQSDSARWSDRGWWNARIDAALATPDPVVENLRITLCHAELSLALREVLGADSGANFHTWAVWGSKKAGRTIRREDAPWLAAATMTAGAIVGAALLCGRRAPTPLGAAVGAAAGAAGSRALLSRSAAMILAGNATVLDDIGRVSAAFIAAFWEPGNRNAERLAEFVANVPDGDAVDGGKRLLRSAFAAYLEGSLSDDPDETQELILYGNLAALLHEHQRLDPYIDRSLPRPVRRLVTARMLDFAVGDEHLDVASDVPAPELPDPPTLRTIETERLDRFLHGTPGRPGWDRTPGTRVGSHAGDWTRIEDRMNFVVDLFHTRHTDPDLFLPPYPKEAASAIDAGRIPAVPL